MKNLVLTLFGIAMLTGSVLAQDDNKIRVEITKEIDGEMRTFKGEYNNEEEMRADPEYQKFAGDDDSFQIFFGDEELADLMGSFSFNFDDDAFNGFQFGGPNGHSFHFDGDAMAFDFRMDSEELRKEIAEEMEKVQELLKDIDKDLQEEVMKSLEKMEELRHGNRFRDLNTLSIDEVDDEFGKRGKVSKGDELDLEDLSFVNVHGNLKVRFRVPQEDELTIAISTKDDKNIYNRYFESFGGQFSDNIDFSDYSDGEYLLEIVLGDKKLTRKITKD